MGQTHFQNVQVMLGRRMTVFVKASNAVVLDLISPNVSTLSSFVVFSSLQQS